MTLSVGALLNNRYRIISILGQGGMGAVYHAQDENLDIPVAVKENLFLTDEYSRQFQREAIILASLHHPNLPRVGDYFPLPGQGQYLIMDYIGGEDLRQRIERLGPLPEAEVILIGALICDALMYMHTRKPPVVHRDLKPGNIKITPEGEVFLVDFGLAKVMQDNQATTTGARAMTPGYSPPEQYGTARTDPRTDIYSLGATLYAALTGTIPEDGLARMTGKAKLTPLRDLQPRVNRRVAAVIEKALSVDPNDRYQTAVEFSKALLDAGDLTRSAPQRIMITPPPPDSELAAGAASHPVAGVNVGSEPPSESSIPGLASRPRRKRPFRWAFLLTLILIGAGLGYIYVFQPNLPYQLWNQVATRPIKAPDPSQAATSAPPSFTPLPTEASAPTQISSTAIPKPTNPASSKTPLAITQQVTIDPGPARLTPIPKLEGEVAFVSDRTGIMQIWMMTSNGEQPQQITNIKEGACQPNWSPDGMQIAFISPCTEKKDIYDRAKIYLMNVDGTNLRALNVPENPAGDFDPAWSPDGSRIAFTSLRSEKSHIFIFDLNTMVLSEISDSRNADKQPTWAPLGTELLIFNRVLLTGQLWLAPTDGRPASPFTQSGDVTNLWPVWSPDGKTIYYSQLGKDEAIPLLVGMRYEDRFNFRESRIYPREKGATVVMPMAEPGISPDSDRVVFESWPDGRNHDIYRMDLTGENLRRLTNDPGFDFSPAWRPALTKP